MPEDSVGPAERQAPKASPSFYTVYLPQVLEVRNQLFEIERRAHGSSLENLMRRNVRRINGALEAILRQAGDLGEIELLVEDPTGQRYDETRTDCDASITGDAGDELTISETLKPIVRVRSGNSVSIVQRAVVLVDAIAEQTSSTDASPDNRPDAP